MTSLMSQALRKLVHRGINTWAVSRILRQAQDTRSRTLSLPKGVWYLFIHLRPAVLVGPLSQNNTLLLLTNQLRLRPDALFGSRETSTGGQALRHYAAVRLELRRIRAIKHRDAVVGSRLRAVVKKNKVAPPFHQADIEIIFGGGR